MINGSKNQQAIFVLLIYFDGWEGSLGIKSQMLNMEENMFKIGCHLSVSNGFEAMGKDALSVGATYFQFFTRNPRGSKAKDIDPEDISKLRLIMKENGITGALAHAPYTLNPASAEDRVRNFAEEVMKDDLKRLELLPGSLYNLHPGSHVGQGIEKGIELTIEILDKVMWRIRQQQFCLRRCPGKALSLGKTLRSLP